MATGNVTVNITARYVGWQSGRWHQHLTSGGTAAAPDPLYCVGCHLNLEETDGPRYVEALRGARRMRSTVADPWTNWRTRKGPPAIYSPIPGMPLVAASERAYGLPECWLTRDAYPLGGDAYHPDGSIAGRVIGWAESSRGHVVPVLDAADFGDSE